ncbi:hypothetical protein [Arthrobacter castelli]|uniref:hypothetical protein n=1 Tax=Arthrobacter castelli TaxID=271431 RepID=UPI0003FBFD68|nr:hypothetical protein [Arthrobacter castelli]
MSFSRVCGVAAIGFAAIILLVNALVLVPAGMPTTGAAISDVVTFFSTESTAIGLASAFTAPAWVLATLFGAGAVAATWRSEYERGEAWSLVGLAGLILQNGNFVAVIAVRLALASTAADDHNVTVGLWALQEALFTLNGTFLAVALIGLSLSGQRSGLIRPWHAAIGFTAAGLQFSSAVLTPLIMDRGGFLGLLGLAGWLLWVVWIVIYGIVLIRLAPSTRGPRSGNRRLK